MYEPTPLPEDPLERYQALRHPWTFLEHCCFTEDEASILEPVKAAPVEREYLKSLVLLWMQEPLFAIYKSRRMWVTWLFNALHLHYSITNTHRRVFFVSKKEEDADELVKRARFIHDHIPRDIWPEQLLPSYKYKENHLVFPTISSSINAVAQGSDQLRQYTASRIFMDEFAFWDKGKDTYTSSKPTIQAASLDDACGSGVTIVSTPPPQYGTEHSFFFKLCHDMIDG